MPSVVPAHQAPAPQLTPSFCLTPSSLAAFLSRARSLIDDPIGQHLSALSAPSRSPFSAGAQGRMPSTSRLPGASCAAFVQDALIPAWRERDRILTYCEMVAAEAGAPPLAQNEPEPDERLDPYSARTQYQRPESDVEVLRRVLLEERGIEEVVRRRTWGVVRDRCIGVEGDWRQAMQMLLREA